MRVRKALDGVLLNRTRPGRRCVYAVSSRNLQHPLPIRNDTHAVNDWSMIY